ncbi:MAG: hypothetical protein QM817_34045 [Archangium sp.]
MRLLAFVLLASFAGCAHIQLVGDEGAVPVYPLSLEQTRREVVKAFAARGIALEPTQENANVLASPAVETKTESIDTESGSPRMRTLYTSSRRWLVVLEARGPKSTAVRVLRGNVDAWADQAERSHVIAASSGPAVLRGEVPMKFAVDAEAEAALMSVLESVPSVEVMDPAAAEELSGELTPALPASPTAPRGTGLCNVELGALPLEDGEVVFLADPLGANEPLAALDAFACEAAHRSLPITFALSIPLDEQPALNAYLSSNGDAAARTTLLARRFWLRDWQDGRSSLAVLDFLERIRVRRARGEAVTVLAIDINQAGNPRYARAAAVLLRHREANGGLTIAFLGSVMGSRRIGGEWDAQLRPVGARVAGVLPGKVKSLDVAFSAGKHWTCRLGEKGALDCGTFRAVAGPRQRVEAVTPHLFVRLFPSGISPEGFDGVYFVGTLTPSPPAVGSKRIDEGEPPSNSSSR